MTHFTTFARPALLAAALSVLAAPSATADQRVFDDFLRGNASRPISWIEAGGDPHARDKHGATFLHLAAWNGLTRMARRLLELGTDVDVRSDPDSGYGRETPLMKASGKGSVPIVKMFLAAGADVNARSDMNLTPLHFVAHPSGTPGVLALLLDAGADPLVRSNAPGADHHGFLPLDGVRKNNPSLLRSEPGQRLLRLTYEGTGCEGVIVLASDTKISILAERTLGKASRWKEIVELNGLEGKGYKKGDCLALP